MTLTAGPAAPAATTTDEGAGPRYQRLAESARNLRARAGEADRAC